MLFAGRFPGEKAASIFADMSARAFCAAGYETLIIVPRRFGRLQVTQRPYRTVVLPTLDAIGVPLLGSVAGAVNLCAFSLMLSFWFLFCSKRTDLVISNDPLPLLVASIFCNRTLYEMHDFPEGTLWMYRALFRRVPHILATNTWKAAELIVRFHVPREKIIVERNAVDISAFGATEKNVARRMLGIAEDMRMIVYTGHLYEWKGADTLARAAALVSNSEFVFVGGVSPDIERFESTYGTAPNLRIVGQVAHDKVPLWQSAADVLVLPNSAKEEISVHYTSPMKLFEYMASERPIVASDLPSVREILPENAGYYATPDNPESFANCIVRVLAEPAIAAAHAARARTIVQEYTWQKRTARILAALL